MTASSSHEGSPSMEFGERCCVWMSAGILSYQLCDRDFACEQCPLDAAMKQHFRKPARQEEDCSASAVQHEWVLPLQYHYARHHCWVERRGAGVARVGIEPGVAAALMTPKAIAFPVRGGRVIYSQPCLWIVIDGGVFPFLAPLTGTIVATNDVLVTFPHELVLHPLGRGWLFDLLLDQEEDHAHTLLDAQTAQRFYRNDEARFRRLLSESLRGDQDVVGATLADGGQLHDDVSAMIGSQAYLRLLQESFSSNMLDDD